tara:strand:+ start:57 stop:476 length:420 start_codon:yes stop_codon:yes gene_type:complete
MLIDKNSDFEKSLNDYSFGKDKRITKAEDYKKTFSENNKYVGKYLIIWVRINNEEVLRLGIIASKKMHNKANKRNFAKRRIREIFRKLRPYLIKSFDLVIISRKSLLNSSEIEIKKELIDLLYKANVITVKNYNVLIGA